MKINGNVIIPETTEDAYFLLLTAARKTFGGNLYREWSDINFDSLDPYTKMHEFWLECAIGAGIYMRSVCDRVIP